MKKKVTDTTLGELIVALTEETTHAAFEAQDINRVVCSILADLFRRKRLRFKARGREIRQALTKDAHLLA